LKTCQTTNSGSGRPSFEKRLENSRPGIVGGFGTFRQAHLPRGTIPSTCTLRITMTSTTRTNRSHGRSGGLSPFARAIRRLLDDTDYFTRSEWARFLGVSTSALSQWANDKTVPRADLLRIILDVLRSSAGVPPEPLADFDQIARRPAHEVSPLGSRMLPTISDYLGRSTFLRLGNELRGLTAKQQQRVLAEGSWGPSLARCGPKSRGVK
jgi:transcriptional regulator with XRE-family HTH domain